MKRFRKGHLQEAREKPFAIKTNKWTHLSVDMVPQSYSLTWKSAEKIIGLGWWLFVIVN